MPYGISNIFGKIPQNEINSILDFASQNGINTIDTAKAYGDSEEVIGNYISKRPKNNWTIITKLASHEKTIMDQIKDSSAKLTIKPNIILAHSANLFLNHDFQKELSDIMKLKYISKIGVSVYTENEVLKVLKSSIKPNIIQLPMNILDTRLYKNKVLKQIHEMDIEIHIRSVFLQGLFYLRNFEIKRQFPDVLPFIIKLKSIASEANLALPEFSLLWCFALKEVNKIIVGVNNSRELNSHLETLQKKVDFKLFEKALSINYENEEVLNPSLWV
tara:strand:+ start:80 stop:901 length:822 start_codon:yes stop_codon:yes gene_type:complete